MKKYLYFLILLIGISFSSCEKDEPRMALNTNEHSSFRGTFQTINLENLSEDVFLEIDNGSYSCLTSLPFGHGAGKIDVRGNTISFIDTLFFPRPALYGPSYVLSGDYLYEFDGQHLKIWRNNNIGSIEYSLEVSYCKESHHGVLKNLTDLGACGWIIERFDLVKFEPINLNDFDIELVENKPVCFRFQERDDLGSYCMVGKVVELESIE